ncbi:MAG: hypothetical protein CVT64_02405 [Actinobacteria bacterium HGW-Actinobacteria-4]|nr:MAG: hypothetical protein CVT64_02405 [Actinobacteria bacterium HGW-Actinobacteria-4]
MALGTGIFFLVLGAILTFAVGDSVEAVNLVLIGYICMGAGVLAIILSLIVNAQRSNTTHHEVVERTEDTTH